MWEMEVGGSNGRDGGGDEGEDGVTAGANYCRTTYNRDGTYKKSKVRSQKGPLSVLMVHNIAG